MKDKQHERFQKIFYENLYLLNLANTNHEVIFNVSGSTANVYSVKILKSGEWNHIFCNCHDSKKWANYSGVVCKHVLFVIFKVLKLFQYKNNLSLITVSDEGELFLEKKKLHKDYLEVIDIFLELFNINNDTSEFINKDYIQKYNTLRLKQTAEDEDEDKDCSNDTNKQLTDKKKIGHCLICFDDFSELSIELHSQCSVCETIYHKSCVNKWFNHNSSCPLCRSANSFSNSEEMIKEYMNLDD